MELRVATGPFSAGEVMTSCFLARPNTHTSHTLMYIYIYVYLDLPKGAESMIRGAHIPFLRFKQHPLEYAGIYIY